MWNRFWGSATYGFAVIVVYKENRGLSDARNQGAPSVAAPYLGFVDSDGFVDTCMYDILCLNLVEAGADNSCCDVVDHQESDPVSFADAFIQAFKMIVAQEVTPGMVRSRLSRIWAPTKLYLRSLFDGGVRFPAAKTYEDAYAIIDILSNVDKVVVSDARLYFYSHRAGLIIAVLYDELLREVDAVYIAAPIDRHEELIRLALEAGRHVLCESPLFLGERQGKELYALADARGLVLMEALKTLYFPAFDHLKLLLESGVVGEVKDVDASFSHVFDDLDRCDKYQGSFYDMASYIALPAMAFLGNDYLESRLTCAYDKDFCVWTKCDLRYRTASATLKVGRGVKTEGDMVITGTDGYVYVPAPWWKTDYFEVRGEDLRETKKYFYDYAGQGQRYEIGEFVRLVTTDPDEGDLVQSKEDVLVVPRLLGQFDEVEAFDLVQDEYGFGGGRQVVDR